MKKEDILSAWAKIRKIDNSIPDDVLDFMKDSAINNLTNKLSLEDINKLSSQWSSQRSIGDEDEDQECMYDYGMGMRAAYIILKGEPVK